MSALDRESFRVYWTPHAIWWDPRLDSLRGESRFAKIRERVATAWSPEFT